MTEFKIRCSQCWKQTTFSLKPGDTRLVSTILRDQGWSVWVEGETTDYFCPTCMESDENSEPENPSPLCRIANALEQLVVEAKRYNDSIAPAFKQFGVATGKEAQVHHLPGGEQAESQ